MPLQSSDDWRFLEMVKERWSYHCDFVVTVRSIFLCLDRGYALSQGRSLWDVNLSFFGERVRSLTEVDDAPRADDDKSIKYIIFMNRCDRGSTSRCWQLLKWKGTCSCDSDISKHVMSAL